MKKIFGTMFLMFSFISFSNDYYIGEDIVLKISGISSKNEIEKSLENFKIRDIEKNTNDEYVVRFTSFNPGENLIKIGDKELKFNVLSSLSENDTKIYENLEKKENMYVEKDYPYLAIYSIESGIILLILGLYLVIRDILKNPFYIFRKDMRKVTKENWREKISLALRRCIDLNYNTNFLNGDYKIIGVISENDIEFLKKLDYLKFSQDKAGDRTIYQKQATELVKKIKKGEKNNV